MTLACLLFGLACVLPDLPPDHSPPAMNAPNVAMEMAAPAIIKPDVGAPDYFSAGCSVQPPRNLRRHYAAAARRYFDGATDCDLAKQGFAESSFNAEAVSPAGAIGVAQFLPPTAAELGVDPWDPRDSIFGQARYVRWCRERWTPGLGGRTAFDIRALGLSCYNNGLGNMRKNQERNGWVLYREAEPYLPAETTGYVAKIEGQ